MASKKSKTASAVDETTAAKSAKKAKPSFPSIYNKLRTGLRKLTENARSADREYLDKLRIRLNKAMNARDRMALDAIKAEIDSRAAKRLGAGVAELVLRVVDAMWESLTTADKGGDS